MNPRRGAATLAAALLLAVGLTSCGGGGGDEPTDAGEDPTSQREPTTLNVPADYPTVQEALDDTVEGDTVLVAAGTYPEELLVDTPGVTLQGADRNGTVIEGNGTTEASGITVIAPGVTVANLTVRDFAENGVLVTGFTENGGMGRGSGGYETLDPERFPPLEGFAVRYVTASNNGLYGIYAFDSRDGVIEQNYASGHPDSGIYVGQCTECDIVVRDNVSERNAVGYEQANASDSVVVTGNRLVGNRVGLTLLSDYQEAFVPNRSTTVVGNLVADNNEEATPHQADGGFGLGIGLSGVVDSVIRANRVLDNESAGIAVDSSADLPPIGNQVRENEVSGNGVDLWYDADRIAPGEDNCFADNQARTTRPADLQTAACPNATGVGVEFVVARDPAGIPYFDVAAPPDQPQMPADAADLGPGSVDVDVDAVGLPPADLFADRSGR